MIAAADVVVHAALRHFLQRERAHLHRFGAERRLPALQRRHAVEEIQHRRPGKFRRAAEAAVHRVERLAEILKCFLEHVARRIGERDRRALHGALARSRGRGEALETFEQPRSLLGDLPTLLAPRFRHGVEQRDESRASAAIGRRIIRAAEKRFQLGRQPRAQRPATAAGDGLHERHVDVVDVGPFFAVHLDGDEMRVEHGGDLRVFERLVRHHVAPVAGRVADREKDRLVLGPRAGERRFAPRIPVDGIGGVLQQVGRFFTGETVRHGRRTEAQLPSLGKSAPRLPLSRLQFFAA